MTLGWIGDHGSIHYLEKMKPIFERIGEKYPHVELKIVCDTFFDCDRMKVIKKNWSSEEEVADLQGFDIGLMPLVDDPWSWGKCGLKIIQYQGVGVPVVCTPVGINKDLVEDGVNGFYAMTPEEWEEKLSLLIENSGLRERMGREGRRRVLENYTFQACAPRLLSILTSDDGEPIEGKGDLIERSNCQLCKMGDYAFPLLRNPSSIPALDGSRIFTSPSFRGNAILSRI